MPFASRTLMFSLSSDGVIVRRRVRDAGVPSRFTTARLRLGGASAGKAQISSS